MSAPDTRSRNQASEPDLHEGQLAEAVSDPQHSRAAPVLLHDVVFAERVFRVSGHALGREFVERDRAGDAEEERVSGAALLHDDGVGAEADEVHAVGQMPPHLLRELVQEVRGEQQPQHAVDVLLAAANVSLWAQETDICLATI
eukprot:2199330-Rhodomonas_salina.7